MSAHSLPRMLDAAATRDALAYPALLEALRQAVIELDAGRIACPDRLVVPMADGATLLSMPAVADDLASHKLITVAPANARRGLPTIRGQVTVIDPRTGRTRLMLDGPTVTGRRTAAISMLALGTLAPRPPVHILLIGTGTQAQHHLEAIEALFPAARLSVRGSSAASAARFCERNAACRLVLGPDSAGSDSADAVITCTTSRQPIYVDAARADRIVIAVGSFHADAAEVGAVTVLGSAPYVDDAKAALHEAGDLILAGVDWGQVRSLADALRDGPPAGRPVFFKSVGCAAWDLAAARIAVRAASDDGTAQAS